MDTLTLKDLEDIQEYESGLSEEHSWGVVDRDQLRSLLSLARRQLEHPLGSPEGLRPPASACAPPQGTDVLRDVEKYLNQADQLVERCLHLLDNNAPQMARDAAYDAAAAISDASRALHTILPLDLELKPRAVESDLCPECSGHEFSYKKSGPRERCLGTGTASLSTPATDQSAEGKTDTERLDRLETVISKSSTGISFEKIPICEGQAGGFRFMKRHHIGQPKKTLRECIDKAMFDETKGDAS